MQLTAVVVVLTVVAAVTHVDAGNTTSVSPSLSSVNENDLGDDDALSYGSGSGSGSSDDDGTYADDYDANGHHDDNTQLINATCGTMISLSSASSWKTLLLTVPHTEKYTFYLGGDVTYVKLASSRAILHPLFSFPIGNM